MENLSNKEIGLMAVAYLLGMFLQWFGFIILVVCGLFIVARGKKNG